MLNKDRSGIVATCDICHADVLKQDSIHLVNCHANAVHEGRIEAVDEDD